MHLNGPGKYDNECAHVMAATNASACMLIIVDGNKGQGVSLKTSSPYVFAAMPTLLRMLADQIEKDIGDVDG